MTPQLEKVFFNYILVNKKYYRVVKPFFFKNSEIQYVYDIVRNYMLNSEDPKTPTPRQILDMVNLEDKQGVITKDILKSILKVNLDEYNEKDFILPKFNGWVLSNRVKTGVVDVMEESRDMENTSNFDEVITHANKIKSIMDEMSSTSFVQDDNLGLDFDEVESHVQDSSKYKVPSGFKTLDHMLGDGWDVKTLNVLMAETGGGKSLWMQNFSYKSANLGYNVLYITLEMSELKVMKRVGAMRLKIPINEYDDLSKDREFIKKKINSLKDNQDGDLFDKKLGKIITKFWAAGTATVNDFDDFLQQLKERKGIDIDIIMVDYITLIAPTDKGKSDNLYTKGKQLAEGLRALGSKYNCPVITGVQIAKDAWNASDITLESVPESKAIAETADTFFAIIRTEEMKRQNLYRFKLLKQRDGDFLKSQIRLNLNEKYLSLENDQFIDQ